MIVVLALVVILSLWGAFNEEIGWWEAIAYILITVAGAAAVILLRLPPTLSFIPGVVCGIILLFRCGISNARQR